jgi:hypothetical protein
MMNKEDKIKNEIKNEIKIKKIIKLKRQKTNDILYFLILYNS